VYLVQEQEIIHCLVVKGTIERYKDALPMPNGLSCDLTSVAEVMAESA
jgi:hypothetical protein